MINKFYEVRFIFAGLKKSENRNTSNRDCPVGVTGLVYPLSSIRDIAA